MKIGKNAYFLCKKGCFVLLRLTLFLSAGKTLFPCIHKGLAAPSYCLTLFLLKRKKEIYIYIIYIYVYQNRVRQ